MTPATRFAFHFSRRDVPERMKAVQQALEEAAASDHARRAALHATLTACQVVTALERAPETAAAAAREAALAGDDVSRAWALLAEALAHLTPAALVRRHEIARELLRIAETTGAHDFAPTAYFLLLSALAEAGAVSELDSALTPTGPELSAFPELADSRYVAWFRCLRATLDGRSERAEQLAHEAYEIAQREDDPDAQGVWVGQLAIIRWKQGRVAELEQAFLDRRQIYPDEPIWAVTLAWIWLAQGRRSAARALVASLPPVDRMLQDRNWLATICILAVVAADLGETTIAAAARTVLLPFEDRLTTIGLGVTCWGVVARPLALTAQLLGDVDAAIGHYRRAIEVSARIGAHAWLAEAQWELAALLAEHSEAHREEAIDLASEAASTGRALQLHGVEGAAAAVLAALNRTGEPRRAAEPVKTARPRIRVLGGFEVAAADGTVARWQSRKARELLKILVARRGVAIGRETLMDLLWPDEAPGRLANRFSVAATTVRRAFDPQRIHRSDAFLDTSGDLVRLHLDRLDIDAERFLGDVQAALASDLPEADILPLLTATLDRHGGEALVDEPYALWAERLRRDVQVAFFAAAHRLAEAAHATGDQFARVEAYRRILAADEYDQRAHEGLIDALERLGAQSHAAAAQEAYATHMADLGIRPQAAADAVPAR